MLFRPSFCAHCGEKIDRSDWGISTSRRFCQVCESQFKGQDLIPRVVVFLCLLIGLIGIGGYVKSGSQTPETQKLSRKITEKSPPLARARVNEPQSIEIDPANTTAAAVPETQKFSPLRKPELAQAREPQKSLSQPIDPVPAVYSCGAQTVKGTPCKRRVKANVRCFQHTGTPAMLTPDKLRIN